MLNYKANSFEITHPDKSRLISAAPDEFWAYQTFNILSIANWEQPSILKKPLEATELTNCNYNLAGLQDTLDTQCKTFLVYTAAV